jgi:hypothetical protein
VSSNSASLITLSAFTVHRAPLGSGGLDYRGGGFQYMLEAYSPDELAVDQIPSPFSTSSTTTNYPPDHRDTIELTLGLGLAMRRVKKIRPA